MASATPTASRHAARDVRLAAPFAGAVALTLLTQLGGQALFGINFTRFVFSDEGREQFLTRTVSQYEPVPWINGNLSSEHKILILHRQLTYHIDIPVLLAHPVQVAVVELRMTTQDPPRFLRQLRAQGITHLLAPLRQAEMGTDWAGEPATFARNLVSAGCAEIISRFDTTNRPSRTISTSSATTYPVGVFKITNPSCPL
mgnify:CR=1 FL=1